MTAAALLRRLEAATGPRDFSDLTRQERFERVAAWHATRNLLPLLAGLVEAVAFAERESRVDPRVALLPYGVSKALAALEAAAKEGV